MPKSKIKKIAISTGGGDAPGLNSVIRAAVRKINREYGWEILGIHESFEGLITGEGNIELTENSVKGILTKGGTILGTSNRANPFAYPVQRGDKLVAVDRSGLCIERMKGMEIDALMIIGGDGTMHIANRFHELGCPVVGVPKTIDNDVLGTERTFGFETAVDIVSWALDKLHTTAESHDRVMVVEVMGREAGWISLYGGIAGGADVILIPEIPFTYKNICHKIHERQARGRDFSIIVAAEGAKPKGGEESIVEKGDERFGLPRLGGIGYRIKEGISTYTELEIRVVVLGHLQRGGSPNTFDRVLASRFGCAAVELIAKGKFGHMVCLNGEQISSVPIKEAIKGNKLVDPDGELVNVARSLGISFGDG